MVRLFGVECSWSSSARLSALREAFGGDVDGGYVEAGLDYGEGEEGFALSWLVRGLRFVVSSAPPMMMDPSPWSGSIW